MFSSAKSDHLLSKIRDGISMTGGEKFNLICLLSIPSILAQMTSVVMFLIDQAMVGSLGAEAPASIGLVESTIWLFGGLSSAFSLGFSVQTSHFIGANDFDKARQVVRHGIICCLVFSLTMMAVAALISRSLPVWLGGGDDIVEDASTYFLIFAFGIPLMQMNNLSSAMLKCEGKMRISSALSVSLCVLDMLFNFFFIFPSRHITLLGTEWYMPGLGLGVKGAALGTALAFAIVMLIQCWFAFYRSEELGVIRLKTKMVFKASYIRNALKISVPLACQSVLMSGAQIVSTMIVAPLGNFAIAAHTFAITAESLCYMPGFGIGEAATTLVGQSVGAARRDLCRSFAYMTVFTGMIVMTLMGIIMYITAPDLMAVMTPVEAIRDLGTDCLRIEAFAEPMFAASIVVYQVCVGAGDTLKPAIINLGSMWVIRLTLAALLATTYGLQGVWFAMAVELTVRGILFLIRLFRGRWLALGAETGKD
ncbi:MAG: MATE family efflux transporter [Prevotella sp.]|jgi:putative MATE family efflux protein|nr:MATE family efflux transporter [Prevotella sp.]MBR7049284.1 MATE family efflux transporter [Prevotella sp.]